MDEFNEKDELGSTYSDFYKEVHGIRPRWVNHDAVTVEWYREALAQLQVESDEQWERQKELDAKNIAVFEKSVASLIEAGAKDRATALRWIHDANDTNGDWEYLCYKLELPYGYFNKKAV